MGLFGGSFTTGLASGLATSVGTAIKDDMERRETRLDKLRTFYETRQVQEQDRAKAEDKRTENHLTRLRNEAGIGAAEVVALYKGLGGTNDSLDNHFSTVDTNKTLGGTTFDYTDMLKNSGVDLSQYGNFTMQDALDNFRYEISAPDINYTEAPSMLSALGLKQDSDKVSASLTRDMQDLVPNVSRIDSGIKSMAMPEGFYSGTEQALKAKADRTEYDLKDRVGVANEAVQAAQNLIYKIKDSEKNLSPEEYEEQLAEANLALERATKRQKGAIKLAQTVSTMTNRADIISLPLRAGVYEKAKKALDDSIQFGGVGDKASAIIVEGDTFTTITGVEKKAGDELVGEDAAKYRAEKQYDYDYDLVANTLTDDAGEFVEGSAKLMMEDGLNLISNSVYLDYLKTIGKEDTTPPVVPAAIPKTIENIEENVTEILGQLDIPNMTFDEIEAKKADIIFNATRAVQTAAEDAAVRAQLKKIFAAKGLPVTEQPKIPSGDDPEESKIKAAQDAFRKEIEGDPVNYLVERINATGTFIPEEDSRRITKVFYNKIKRNNPSPLYGDYENEDAAKAEYNKVLENPAVIEALQNAWDRLPVKDKEDESILVQYSRRGVDVGKFGTLEYYKNKKPKSEQN